MLCLLRTHSYHFKESPFAVRISDGTRVDHSSASLSSVYFSMTLIPSDHLNSGMTMYTLYNHPTTTSLTLTHHVFSFGTSISSVTNSLRPVQTSISSNRTHFVLFQNLYTTTNSANTGNRI